MAQDSEQYKDDFQTRVHKSFEEWRTSVSDRLSPEDEQRVNGLRDAVVVRDSERAKEHLSSTRETNSWIYEELMKHPEISAIMRELAILGF
jgi:hypothetical protein